MRAFRRPLVVALLFATWAGLTAARVRVWRSEVSLWRDAHAQAPCAPRPAWQLALAGAAAGDSASVLEGTAALPRITDPEGPCARR